jgi:hypothetical protein
MKIRFNREEKILIAGSFLAFNSFIVGFFSSNGSEISNMFLRTYNAFVFYGVIWVITRF